MMGVVNWILGIQAVAHTLIYRDTNRHMFIYIGGYFRKSGPFNEK